MNTPQEFEPLGYWMGWEITYTTLQGRSWFHSVTGFHGVVAAKTSLTDAECIEALNRLMEKGIIWNLDHADKNDLDCPDEGIELILYTSASGMIRSGYQPTINQAVEQALLNLIAAERGEE